MPVAEPRVATVSTVPSSYSTFITTLPLSPAGSSHRFSAVYVSFTSFCAHTPVASVSSLSVIHASTAERIVARPRFGVVDAKVTATDGYLTTT